MWSLLLPMSSSCSCPGSHQALWHFEQCGAVPGSRGPERMPYFQLFMLPAAPNPCHRVSKWENMSWDHATCLSALLSRPAGSRWVALLLLSHCASSALGTASLGTGMPRHRPPGGDGPTATQGCSPGADPGSAAGFRVSARRLSYSSSARISQAVRALLSPWQRVLAKSDIQGQLELKMRHCEFLAEVMAQRSVGQQGTLGLMCSGSGEALCFVVWLLVPSRLGGSGLRLDVTTARTMSRLKMEHASPTRLILSLPWSRLLESSSEPWDGASSLCCLRAPRSSLDGW
ncbi:hypothetical protein Nmel_015670 [Mimus melanotis]